MKTNKSYAKRVKVTKAGAVLVRHGGTNHFNAKMSRSKQLNNRRKNTLVMTAKARTRFLTGLS